MNANRSRPEGLHLATVAHDGHIWEAYLEVEDDGVPDSCRARLRFDPPGGKQGGEYRTALIIVEPTYDEAVARARSLDERQLQGLLRSVLPGDEEAGGATG